MALMHDMMPAFELFQPASVDEALALVAEHGRDAWILAGGQDSLDWFKDRVKRPRVVVDIGALTALKGVRVGADGVEIGALTTLTEIAAHPDIVAQYGLLARAAERVAVPQIRNVGTLGGNLAQDARCWYYRSGWSCYRAGGNLCYADAPGGMNREHAVFGTERCVAASPSDTAPAVVALEGSVVMRSRRGERVVAAEQFFMRPAVDPRRMTVLEPGELITSIRIPPTWRGARFYFEKVADRPAWDFALASVAAAVVERDGRIDRARIVLGGVAPFPLRLTHVEAAVRGRARDEATAELAGELAVRGARPLAHNAFKVGLARNLVMRALRGAEA
jgi:xanthine dehydrogenase YagS FAD-binding subunit